jgi:uncharacterized protein YdiU (UPF0061 family)
MIEAILVTKEPIVKKIFSLVSNKIGIDLKICDNTDEITEKSDLIILDEEFINDRFNIVKTYSKRIGAISSEDLDFNKQRDFLINRPFLPSQLEVLLNEQIEFLKQQEVSTKEEKKKKIEIEEEKETLDPAVNYLSSLADDILDEMEEEDDESVVSTSAMDHGGVLDNVELTKIKEILNNQNDPTLTNKEYVLNEEDWMDLNDIIEKAISEVKDYEFEEEKPIKLVLNNYSIDELRPLFNRLNQNIIDNLANGDEITLQLKLREGNAK